MTLLLNKKNLAVSGCAVLFLVLIAIVLTAGFAEAATTAPAPKPAKGALATGGIVAAKTLGDIAVTGLTAYGLLYVAQAIGSGLLVIASYVLDNAFYWNTQLNPSVMPVVQEGWRIARDLANALFILIILWIAFTIIFNIETLGGSKLLVRVIVVALLINFSLTMVSAVFGLTNEIARPFRDKISPSSDAGAFYLSSIILINTKLQTTGKQINQGEIDKLKTSLDQTTVPPPLDASQTRKDIPSKFLAYLGAPQEAQADAVSTAKTVCGLGALAFLIPVVGTTITTASTVCVGATMIYEFARSLGTGATETAGLPETLFVHVLNLAIGALFLFVTAFALFVAGVTLLARIIAMIFLSILAPFAFLLHLVPNFGDRYWNMWLNALFRWAFYAPAFYFLMYFSLYTLQVMNAGQPAFTASSQSLPQLLIIIIFLALLFGAIMLGRKMGITVADTIINWGQKAGWGALGYADGLATSGLRRAGLAAVRGAAPPEGTVQRILRGAARFPGTRIITKPVAGAYLSQLQVQQKEVRDAAGKLIALRKEDKIAAFQRATFAKDVVGAALALGPDLKELKDAQFNRALQLAGQFGLQDDILKVRPDKAPDETTRERIIKLIKPSDMPNLAQEAFNDTTLPLMWKLQGPEYLRQLAQSGKDNLVTKYMDWIRDNPARVENIKPETYRFLEGSAAHGFGLGLPVDSKPPQIILAEQQKKARQEAEEKEKERQKTATREQEQQTARREQRAITIQELLATKRNEAVLLQQRVRELTRRMITTSNPVQAHQAQMELNEVSAQVKRVSSEIRRLETRMSGRGAGTP